MKLIDALADTPLARFVTWLVEWRQLSVCIAIALVVMSALGVVYTAHETRQMYAELQSLQAREDFLDSEYEKLLLEQSAWADYSRVDQLSRSELGMASPDAEDIVVVTNGLTR